jgi:ribosome-associated protein
MTDDSDAFLKIFIKAALGKKAEYPVILDVRKLSSIADYFIICSGRSTRQVKAIAEHVLEELKTHGIRPLSVEGEKEGHWALLDYGSVVIHVFYDPVRSFYDLEGLWCDARRIPIPSMPENTVQGESTGNDTREG